MRHLCLAAIMSLAAVAGASARPAQPLPLKPDLAPLNFLVGRWWSEDGRVADTGQASRGRSTFSVEAGGAALLRRDHTDLMDKGGQVTGGMDQVMLLYAERGQLKADYTDGEHVIHYVEAAVTPDKSVVFTSKPSGGAPTFRLAYELVDPKTLSVTFSMAGAGAADFHPVATGTLRKGVKPPTRRQVSATTAAATSR